MRERPSPSLKLPLLALVGCVALAFTAVGCRRAVRPEMGGERTVEAGVPVAFGSAQKDAPAVTWEFGDGEQARGARVTHGFPRAGTYTVRALDDGEEVGRTLVTVVPRPVLRAIPAQARAALWVPRLRGNLPPLVDFAEQLVGPENAQMALGQAPLVSLVLQSLREGAAPGVVDTEEGLGFFTVPGFDGVLGALGVTQPGPALEAASREFEAAGNQVQPAQDGLVRVQPLEGGPVFLFVDRGYLYLAMPEDAPEPAEGSRDVAVARRAVEGLEGSGLAGEALLEELRPQVAEGQAYIFARPTESQGAGEVRAVLASLAARPERLALDGFLSTQRPLFEGRRAPASTLLKQAPLGPVAAALVSVPPQEMARLVFGAPGSPQRAQMTERLAAQGLDAEALLQALRGDVALLAYFDAPAFYRNFILNKRPDVRGSLLVDAGLTRAEPVVQAVTRWLEKSGLPRLETRKEGPVHRFRTRLFEQPVLLSVAPERATLQLGEALEARPQGDLGAALRERFGGSAFEEGHVSLMVDVGRLRQELESPREVPGVPPAQLNAARAFGGALLDQLTPLDHAVLDFTPVEGGGRFSGSFVLRPR